MKLGDNIRYLLEENNMTQRQLAQELDITPAALGNYIRNIREPDFDMLLRIAGFFRVSTDFLLGHQNKKEELTRSEELLLQIFRSLTPDQREIYLEQGKLFIRQNNKKMSFPSDNSARNDIVS